MPEVVTKHKRKIWPKRGFLCSWSVSSPNQRPKKTRSDAYPLVWPLCTYGFFLCSHQHPCAYCLSCTLTTLLINIPLSSPHLPPSYGMIHHQWIHVWNVYQSMLLPYRKRGKLWRDLAQHNTREKNMFPRSYLASLAMSLRAVVIHELIASPLPSCCRGVTCSTGT